MTAAAGAAREPRVLQRGGRRARGGGNTLLLYEVEGRKALLKVYRRRGGWLREWLKRLSYRFFEARRGVTARQRLHNERASLLRWREEGFDVPRVLDLPVPEAYAREPALWLEYCPGPLLYELVRNPDWPFDERRREVVRFAADLARRQRRALEQGDHRLVMKHASLKHVLLHEGRQVSFDLEAVDAPRVPIRGALADELAGFTRSLLRVVPARDREALGEALLAGYGERALLREIAEYGLRSGGLRRALKRRGDRRRRRGFSEADALRWLLEREPRVAALAADRG